MNTVPPSRNYYDSSHQSGKSPSVAPFHTPGVRPHAKTSDRPYLTHGPEKIPTWSEKLISSVRNIFWKVLDVFKSKPWNPSKTTVQREVEGRVKEPERAALFRAPVQNKVTHSPQRLSIEEKLVAKKWETITHHNSARRKVLGAIWAAWLLSVSTSVSAALENVVFSGNTLPEKNSGLRASTKNRGIHLTPDCSAYISWLCRDLKLPSSASFRQISVESSGNPNAEHEGSQGLMQVKPIIIQDVFNRPQIYAPIFAMFSETTLSFNDGKSKRALEILFSPKDDWRKEWAKNFLMYQLFNPQVNLLFGHVYLAVNRMLVRPKIETYQTELANFFADEMNPDRYRYIVSMRKRIGASIPSYEDITERYASRISDDSEFAAVTRSLAQYNWGNRPRPKSLLYAAAIQYDERTV